MRWEVLINAKVEIPFEVEVKSNRNTSHTINSGRKDNCSRTGTPRKERDAEETEENGGRRQQFKHILRDTTENQRGVLLETAGGAVLIYSGGKFKPVVSLDHDYVGKHQGRLMYSGDTKVSMARKTNINKNKSDISHRFQRVNPFGKSPMVSPVNEDVKSSDESGSWFWSYKSKGNNNVGSTSQIAPIQMDMKRLATGGVSNIHSDQHIPLRPVKCKGSESQEVGKLRCVVPEGTTKNKVVSREKGQISDHRTGRSHVQPSEIYHLKEINDRDEIRMMDVTVHDYNERVTPRSTEQFNGQPIRYNFANNRDNHVAVTAGSEAVNEHDKNECWMSKTTRGDDNPWQGIGYDSRSSPAIGRGGTQSRREGWVRDEIDVLNYYDKQDGSIKKLLVKRDTPGLANVNMGIQTARVRTKMPHSKEIWNNQGVTKPRSSSVVSNKGQSGKENWASGYVNGSRHSGLMKVDVRGTRHTLSDTPNSEKKNTRISTIQDRRMRPSNLDVRGNRGVGRSNHYRPLRQNGARRTISDWEVINYGDEYYSSFEQGKESCSSDNSITEVLIREEVKCPIEENPVQVECQREEPLKRTSVSILKNILGNKPQWIRLNTDLKGQCRIDGTGGKAYSASTTVTANPTMNRVRLDPKARCYVPQRHSYHQQEEIIMTAEVDKEYAKVEDSVKDIHQIVEPLNKPSSDKTSEAPMVWNLKGRSIDDILRDLDALKNDPDVPMPIIEADLASADDFEQYTKSVAKEEGRYDTAGDLMEEREKDSECLETLRKITGPGLEEQRPKFFPVDLWPYVFNDQKPLIKERWEGYDENILPTLIDTFLQELKVSDERPYAKPYFLAQALANLDRFIIKSSVGILPLIDSKFTHRMELLPGTRARKELPQRFSETQNAFLKAKLSILEEQGRIRAG